MSAFTDLELDYLHGARRLARIATVGTGGTPHVVPVGFTHNREQTRSTSAAVTSSRPRSSATSLAAAAQPSSSTILRAPIPGDLRGIEVRGRAEALTEPRALIRIHPARIVSWGIEPNRLARSVGVWTPAARESPNPAGI